MKIQRYNPNVESGQFGIISGEPGDVYHANPAISNSDLSLFLNDPKRFEAILNGEIEKESTKSQEFGDMFHVRFLESVEVFQSRFVLDSYVPSKPRKDQYEAHANYICEFKPSESIGEGEKQKKPTKAQIDAQAKRDKLIREYDQFWKVHEGKKLVTSDDVNRAKRMCDAIFSDPDAAPLLTNLEDMHRELTVRTQELDYGFSVQAKIDVYDEKNNVINDLKTVENLDIFNRNFVKFGYYRQAAFYTNVAELEFGHKVDQFNFIAVEKQPPHEVAVFTAKPHAIAQGIREIKTGLQSLGRALETDNFSKRYPGIVELDLEEWDDKRIKARLERLESEVAA